MKKNNVKSILTLLLILISGFAFSQEMKIESFRCLENDLSARMAKIEDINNELCALLIINTPEKGFEFFGCNVEDVIQKTGEIWVFVSPRVKFITIKHRDYGSIRNYPFPEPIRSGNVYEMKLKTTKSPQPIDTNSVKNIVEQKLNEILSQQSKGNEIPNNFISRSDVTLFKGIPIDGTKEQMVEELKKKGFRDTRETLRYLRTGFYGLESGELLSGEFNGMQVIVSVIENKGKVCGIGVVEDLKRNEAQIKRAFNDLVEQFNNHKNYTPYKANQKIDASEDISYKMRINNKEYRAIFYQKGLDGTTSTKRKVIVSLCEDGSDFRLLMYYENGFNAADGSDL